jgi:hypothetical protein
VDFGSFKPFLLENSERMKNHAVAMAPKTGPTVSIPQIEHRQRGSSAKTGPQRDAIRHGLVCIFSILEPAVASRFCLRNRFRISVLLSNRRGGSVCICTSISWIVTSA